MRKSTRLNDMMIFLNDKSFFNLKDIMQEYGISKSTAIRDIQSLEEIGMPIFSETGRNGRYGILKNRLLSPIIFTVDEMYALYFAMLTLNAYESTPFHLSIGKLKKKFETCLSDELISNIHKMERTLSLEGASGLNTSLYKVVYSSLSTLTVNDFYRNLAAELGAQPAFRKTDNFKIIQDEINRLVLEKRQTPVIIIDEANYIGNAVLNDLKMLFNFEMDSKDQAVVLLSGLPQLNSTLRLSIHEPFRQRIVMNYNLEGMTKAEGHSYVAAKLNGAGCTQTVFEDNALEAILNAANGTPRMINKLCNASLLVGNSSNLNIITADAVMQAINDCELG